MHDFFFQCDYFLRGSRICNPRMCHLVMWIILNKRQSGGASYLPLNCLKVFRQGTCIRKAAITNNNILYPKNLSVWHGKRLFPKHLLLSASCEMSLSFETATPTRFSLAPDQPQLPDCQHYHIFIGLPNVQNLFFSCSSVFCQFNQQTSQTTLKGRRENFSTSTVFFPIVSIIFLFRTYFTQVHTHLGLLELVL